MDNPELQNERLEVYFFVFVGEEIVACVRTCLKSVIVPPPPGRAYIDHRVNGEAHVGAEIYGVQS